MDRDAWSSHNWVECRTAEVEPGHQLIQYRCSRCRRDFLEAPPTGERYAVYVSVFSFRGLPKPGTKRWPVELSSGEPLPNDIDLRRRLIENRAR
jgi:hypothetical protein